MKTMFRQKLNIITTHLVGLLLLSSMHAQAVSLATEPLLTGTGADIQPNILFVMDDSGSMAFTYLPDAADDFRYDYGYLSSHCNRIYYNPSIIYDPPVTSQLPDENGNFTSYPDSDFTAAHDDGFNPDSGIRNLGTEFTANRFVPEGANTDFGSSGGYLNFDLGVSSAVYYQYTGAETDRDYADTSSTFYTECNTAIQDTVVGIVRYTDVNSAVFQRRRLSTNMVTTIDVLGSDADYQITSIQVDGVTITNAAITTDDDESKTAASIASAINQNDYSATSSGSTVTVTGPDSAANQWPGIVANTSDINNLDLRVDIFPETGAAELTNFANWYSYYRARFLSMKTSAGLAFGRLNDKFRVGYMRISDEKPTHLLSTFEGAERDDWYSELYGTGFQKIGTPLRKALSVAGRYYGGKFTIIDPKEGETSFADPMQYSCQQNYTLLSSDGYWNTAAGTKLDGSSAIGNQDGVDADGNPQANRPQFDGTYFSSEQRTVTYERTIYSKEKHADCNGKKRKLKEQKQRANCEVSTKQAGCTPSENSWESYDSPTFVGSCQKKGDIGLPDPNPSDIYEVARVASTTNVVNDSSRSDTLADVAQYYYVTDLRNGDAESAICTGAARPDGTSGDVCENNVATSERDDNENQHMTTFTLGLGVNGLMKFIPNYENVDGDYKDILNAEKKSATKCTWEVTDGDTCNWPSGMADSGQPPQNIDDLWHAAVNGRGTYFSAEDPTTLAQGIAEALIGIGQRRGSAAAASSSSLNPVKGNNSAFVASYINKAWTGNLEARTIDTTTAVTSESASWCAEDINAGSCTTSLTSETINDSEIYYCETPASNTCGDGGGVLGVSADPNNDAVVCKTEVRSSCDGKFTTIRKDATLSAAEAVVSGASDNRTIYTAAKVSTGDDENGDPLPLTLELVPFNNDFGEAHPNYFGTNQLVNLSQWSTLTPTQRINAELNIIGYLRGQYDYDMNPANETSTIDNRLFRERDAILGDILESKPTYSGKSLFRYEYPGYQAFKTSQNAKTVVQDGTVYVGANDGMLHAFAADSGEERWAYIPSMVVPNLYKLADVDYYMNDKHQNFVNGSPALGDVCIAEDCNIATTGADAWRTIAVVGLNAGGRGYFALDVTSPETPELLWEFTTTNGLSGHPDDDLGYSYAKPIITRTANGRWVVLVTSGYNNDEGSVGDGEGYLFVLSAATGEVINKYNTGTTGLAKIAAWNNVSNGNEAQYVYGGDLDGNLWRFDISKDNTEATAVLKFAELKDAAGNSQPITTKPLLASINGNRVVYVATGKLLEKTDEDTKGTQTVYAIKDDNVATALGNIRAISGTGGMVAQTVTNTANGQERTVANATVNWDTNRGWYADLPDDGERVHADGLITQGIIAFPSTVPTSTACEPSGYGWLNFFDYQTGGPVEGFVGQKFQYPIAGIGVLSVGGTSRINVVDIRGNIELATPEPTGEAGKFTGTRTLWRELIE